jgi:putative effector of murein hydrolase LrgA (UPF0299 family)
MMKADRDSFIIVLTFVPLAVALLLFLLWKATGNGPFDLPQWTVSLNEPNLSVRQVPGVVGLVNWVQGSKQSITSLIIGVVIGLVGGIIIVGLVLDVTRGLRKVRAGAGEGDGSQGTAH